MGKINNKALWSACIAQNPPSPWESAHASAATPITALNIQYVYISDKRVDEFEKDIKELKEKVNNIERILNTQSSNSLLTMLASEAVLRKDWDSPEEDKAWEAL
jgi:hypothetical protein